MHFIQCLLPFINDLAAMRVRNPRNLDLVHSSVMCLVVSMQFDLMMDLDGWFNAIRQSFERFRYG